MAYRAILIPADSAPEWIDLADHGPAVCAAIGGDLDFATLIRPDGGRGVQLAVHEYSLLNDMPHNAVASDIVAALGRTWHVHGPAVLLGLSGPATADLTVEQWDGLAALAAVGRAS